MGTNPTVWHNLCLNPSESSSRGGGHLLVTAGALWLVVLACKASPCLSWEWAAGLPLNRCLIEHTSCFYQSEGCNDLLPSTLLKVFRQQQAKNLHKPDRGRNNHVQRHQELDSCEGTRTLILSYSNNQANRSCSKQAARRQMRQGLFACKRCFCSHHQSH